MQVESDAFTGAAQGTCYSHGRYGTCPVMCCETDCLVRKQHVIAALLSYVHALGSSPRYVPSVAHMLTAFQRHTIVCSDSLHASHTAQNSTGRGLVSGLQVTPVQTYRRYAQAL